MIMASYWLLKNYNFILVIIDQFIKMVYYKLVKIIINASKLVKIFLNIIIWHYGLLDIIITNKIINADSIKRKNLLKTINK